MSELERRLAASLMAQDMRGRKEVARLKRELEVAVERARKADDAVHAARAKLVRAQIRLAENESRMKK